MSADTISPMECDREGTKFSFENLRLPENVENQGDAAESESKNLVGSSESEKTNIRYHIAAFKHTKKMKEKKLSTKFSSRSPFTV